MGISYTSHWPFLDQALGQECWRKHFAYVKATGFVHFQLQTSISTGKPALKNKARIEIDCFPVALPVVLCEAIKLPIFTLGFILLFTVDFS